MPLRSNRLIPSLLVLFGLVLGGCASPPSSAVKRLIVVGDSTVDNGNTTFVIGSPAQANQVASIALQKQIDIPDTIRVAQGSPVQVFVARDLDFSAVTP